MALVAELNLIAQVLLQQPWCLLLAAKLTIVLIIAPKLGVIGKVVLCEVAKTASQKFTVRLQHR